jgi:hypothetical protein
MATGRSPTMARASGVNLGGSGAIGSAGWLSSADRNRAPVSVTPAGRVARAIAGGSVATGATDVDVVLDVAGDVDVAARCNVAGARVARSTRDALTDIASAPTLNGGAAADALSAPGPLGIAVTRSVVVDRVPLRRTTSARSSGRTGRTCDIVCCATARAICGTETVGADGAIGSRGTADEGELDVIAGAGRKGVPAAAVTGALTAADTVAGWLGVNNDRMLRPMANGVAWGAGAVVDALPAVIDGVLAVSDSPATALLRAMPTARAANDASGPPMAPRPGRPLPAAVDADGTVP